jgi:uncharacterized NAD(P)/FAD-binding protein YdhS
MRSLDQPGGREPLVAIIGGGASGTLAATHLLRDAASRRYPLRIALIDRLGRHGLGQAYSTTHPDHLLNAPASQMSALADDPGHLVRWAGADPQAFLQRRRYGCYLRDTLDQAERQARPVGTLDRLTADVLAIRQGGQNRRLRVLLPGGRLDADFVILATGNQPPALPPGVPAASGRVITDPWAPGALDAVRDGSPVVVIGTGLTMLDVAIAVASGDQGGRVHAVSRHGLLPRAHVPEPTAPDRIWLPVLANATGTVRLQELMWQVRSAIAARPGDWRDVVDAVRPAVPGLWQRMPAADRRLFVRHVARYWEVHRHRMAPAIAQRITELRCTGRLTVLPGAITGVTEHAGLLRVQVAGSPATAAVGSTGSSLASTELRAGWLVNATGPAGRVGNTADPLLRDLFAAGLARPDPLALGIDASTDGAVLTARGAESGTMFTLGPPLRGLWYETTAIPEIREQAAALADRLTSGHRERERPGSAA